jgi:hypothetical protein
MSDERGAMSDIQFSAHHSSFIASASKVRQKNKLLRVCYDEVAEVGEST